MRRFVLFIFMLAIAHLACCVAVGPTLKMARNDDFAYAYQAKLLAEHGVFAMNGWQTASGGAQAFLGAAVIKVFGFSHTALRWLTMIASTACIPTLVMLARGAGLSKRSSLLVGATWAACPLAIVSAVTFMTDTYAALFVFATLLTFTIACRCSGTSARLAAWAAILALGFAGGTVRQIVWPLPVALLAVALLVRRREGLASLAIVSIAAGYTAVVLCFHRWEQALPYAVPETLETNLRSANGWHDGGLAADRLALDLVLWTTPVWASVWAGSSNARRAVAAMFGVIAVAVFAVGYLQSHDAKLMLPLPPWTGNTLTASGPLPTPPVRYGPAVRELPIEFQLALVGVVGSAVIVIIASLVEGSGRAVRLIRARRGLIVDDAANATLAGCALFVAAYVALLVPRVSFDEAFDRYLIPLIPLVAIFIGTSIDRLHAAAPPTAARRGSLSWWPTLPAIVIALVFAAWGVVTAHDWFARDRAIVVAVDKLIESGAPRPTISAGLEYDAWTQLSTVGHLINGRARNGTDADVSRSDRFASGPWTGDRYFLLLAPVVMPHYIIAIGPIGALEQEVSRRTSTPYSTWLPPYDRDVVTYEVNRHDRPKSEDPP